MRKKSLKSVRLSSNMPALPSCWHSLAFSQAKPLNGFGFAAFIVDLGFDPLSLKPDDEDKFAELQTKELNNGLLAMIGVTGAIVQELVNDKGIFENLGLEGSLPAAFDTGILLRVLEVLFLNSKCQLAK